MKMNNDNPGWTEVLGGHASNPATPRQTGFPIKYKDTVYMVSSIENRIKAQFETWVRSEAMNSISFAEASGKADIANKLASAFQMDFGAGEYNWGPTKAASDPRRTGGKAIITALNSSGGVCKLMFYLLNRCNPAVTEDLTMEIMEHCQIATALAINWSLGNLGAPPSLEEVGAMVLQQEKLLGMENLMESQKTPNQ